MNEKTKFELTQDDFDYILQDYGVDKDLVEDVVREINETGVAEIEDDFRDLVVETISYYVSRLDQEAAKTNPAEREEVSLEEVIEYELERYKVDKGHSKHS